MKFMTCAAAAMGLILSATAVHGDERELTPDRLVASESLPNPVNIEWDAETAGGPSELSGDPSGERVYRSRRTAIVITNGAGGSTLLRSQATNRYYRGVARTEGDDRSRAHNGISLELTR